MSRPSRFKAETKYGKSQDKKANRNLPTMARVGNGGGAVATGRDNFYWIRLVNDDNRLTQCYSLLPLTNNDYIYVRRARDRDLSYYEFDKFIQGAGGTAPPTQVHDHFDNAHGGPDLNPETISTRTLIVGTGCTYTTLGAAMAAVPGTPCTIKVMGITTTETNDVTVSSGVTVIGMGEGSIIGMGANTLHMSDNSYMQDVVVTGSDTEVVDVDNVTGIVLRNVKAIQSAAAFCFRFHQTAGGECYHCIAETTAGNAFGFSVEDDSEVMLWDCDANDASNFTTAFVLDDTAECTTLYCRFAGNSNDVWTAASTTWYDLASQYDAGNITVGGTYVPLPQSAVNLDGRADALILDADGDTTISAPTDDQIDIEIGGTDYGTYTERVHAWDEVYDAGTWYDHQLKDTTDGDHFRQNGATYPTGWTESDAAASVSTNDEFSFWYLRGTNADTSWKYRKQMSRAISDGTWNSFAWGPLLWRDGDFASDLHYWFGLYSDNGAGAIDEDIYIRVHLMWDSGGGTIGSIGWGIRGEEGDGSAGNEFTNPDHTGTWHVFGFPIHQPIWVRSLVRNVAAQTCRSYVGTAPWPRTHTLLLDQNPTAANWDTTENLWLQTHMTRGAGAEDYLFIGAVDFESAV